MNGSPARPIGFDFLTRIVPRIVHVENRNRAFWQRNSYVISNPRTKFHVVACIHSGRGRLSVDSRVETLRAGAVFHFPAGVSLNITVPPEDPACFYSIQYFCAFVNWSGEHPRLELADRRPLPLPPLLTPAVELGIDRAFARAYELWSAAGVGYQWHARLALLDVLALLANDDTATTSRRETTDAIDAAVDYIKANLATPLSRESVAERAGLSPAYFSTAFRRRTGYSFTEYIRNLRVDAAKRYLRTTGLTVAEIARRVGFRDPFHFSRVFRRATGVPPRDFRGF